MISTMDYPINMPIYDLLAFEIKQEFEEEVNMDPEASTSTSSSSGTSAFKISRFDRNKTFMESSVAEVALVLKYGCPCGKSCYEGLKPENVYKHRMQVSHMEAREHELYTMGLIASGLCNERSTTKKFKARHIYQGQEVCFGSYLYFINCTPEYHKTITNKIKTLGVLGKRCAKPKQSCLLTMDVIVQYVYNYLLINCADDIVNNRPLRVTMKKMYSDYETYVDEICPFRSIPFINFEMIVNQQFGQLNFITEDEINTVIGCLNVTKP